jgi:hypothetical protein
MSVWSIASSAFELSAVVLRKAPRVILRERSLRLVILRSEATRDRSLATAVRAPGRLLKTAERQPLDAEGAEERRGAEDYGTNL